MEPQPPSPSPSQVQIARQTGLCRTSGRGPGRATLRTERGRPSISLVGIASLVLAFLCAANTHALENKSLLVEAAPSGDIVVTDKRCGLVWRQVTSQYGLPKITAVEVTEDEITMTAERQIPLTIRWRLSGEDGLEVEIDTPDRGKPIKSDGSSKQPMLAYPPPFYNADAAPFAVMPVDEGAIYSTAKAAPREGDYFGRNFSMPWCGLTDLRRGVMIRLDTPFNATIKLRKYATNDGKRVLPALDWLPSRGSFGSPRGVTFSFVSEGGYVNMAKRFRQELIAAGQFKTFGDKARTTPAVAKLKGAMDMWVFKKEKPLNAADIERIHGYGFERLLLQGFNGTQPGPERAITPDGLAKAQEFGWLVGQYHLYSWIFKKEIEEDPSLGRLCIHESPGHILYKDSPWGVKAYYCPALLKDVLTPVAKAQRDFGLETFFTDTTTAASPRECFDSQHGLTKSEAAEALDDVLQGVADTGMVVGSERGFWWAAPSCHYFEGIETLIDYFNKFATPPKGEYKHKSGPFRTELEGYQKAMIDFNYGPQNRLPLFQLVFHDSVYCTRRWNDHQSRIPELWRLTDLMNICYGTPPIVTFHDKAGPNILRDDLKKTGPRTLRENWAPYRERYLRTYRDVCGWHEQIGFEEMTDHRLLTDDRLVQETRFANGKSVVVNFGETPWQHPEGFTVAPMDYRLSESGLSESSSR